MGTAEHTVVCNACMQQLTPGCQVLTTECGHCFCMGVNPISVDPVFEMCNAHEAASQTISQTTTALHLQTAMRCSYTAIWTIGRCGQILSLCRVRSEHL